MSKFPSKKVLTAWIDYIHENLILIEKTKKTDEDEMRFINEAVEILQKSDDIDLKCGAKVAELYEKIGLFNQNKANDHEQALLFHRKELDMNQKLHQGGDHEKTANSLNNLGNVCDNLNDYSKALDYYQQALAMRERLLKTENGMLSNVPSMFNK